jgi:23S rRNA pseudouridine1911/1915/1917 synthase
MEPSILFENDDMLALDKPAGMLVHSDERSLDPTIVDWLTSRYPNIGGVGDNKARSGIVHRLDRDTSGCLLVAKNAEAFEHLKNQFQERSVRKTYAAFVYGNLKEKEGTLDAPIGRSKSDFRRRSAQRGAKGLLRPAETSWQVRGHTIVGGEVYTYIWFFPKTGRTHQIRVHAKYMSHPIVADKLYAGKLIQGSNLGFTRQALHAHIISFQGWDGQEMTALAPLPKDFQKALEM